MTLDDLKNIDFNNVAGWPTPIKLGGIVLVCFALLGAGYYFLIADEIAVYEQAQQKEESLKEKYKTTKATALNLPAYKQQMEDMHQQFGTLLRQLPNKTEVPNLLVDITQAGVGRGLNFVLFKPDKEKPQEFYAELPINIKVTGSFHELGMFVSDLAALPRIVTVGNIEITTDAKSSALTMAAVARTFRYLEPEEIEALKPKPQAKPGAPGAKPTAAPTATPAPATGGKK
jgi:type IV pilus assembly protein PilO